MLTVIVEHGQSLQDIAIQYCGVVSAIGEIAKLNNISITDKLFAGMTLIVPEAEELQTVKYLEKKGIIPASHIDEVGVGIGYMVIGESFRIA